MIKAEAKMETEKKKAEEIKKNAEIAKQKLKEEMAK